MPSVGLALVRHAIAITILAPAIAKIPQIRNAVSVAIVALRNYCVQHRESNIVDPVLIMRPARASPKTVQGNPRGIPRAIASSAADSTERDRLKGYFRRPAVRA